jgi:two-component system, OmpR family, sensor histidine kinase BaeS
MMRSLRSRLIFSHVLPLLISIPLLALAFSFAWTSLAALSTADAVLSPSVEAIKAQAELIARLAGRDAEVLADQAGVEELLRGLVSDAVAINFYDRSGALLVAAPDGPAVAMPDAGVSAILNGARSTQVQVTSAQRGQLIRIVTPILDAENRMLGVLLVSHEVTTAQGIITQVILLLGAAVLVLLVAGVGLGVWLSLGMSASLQRATAALHDIAADSAQSSLPDQSIREIDELYRAVNGLVERLHSLEAARRRLLANLVHELGRPLGSMRAAIYALRQGADEEPELRRELLSGLDAQIDRLEPLLTELTELHAQVLGALELERAPTPLALWLNDLAVIWRASAEQKAIAWRSDIRLDLPAANIDPRQMGRAVGNLLSNAVKFTPAGGAIELRACIVPSSGSSADDSRACCVISVRDTGPGIAAADHVRIFDPFQRGAAQQRFPQGMGLGLSIARDIVVAHGGTIEVVSEAGQGSEFMVKFPV